MAGVVGVSNSETPHALTRTCQVLERNLQDHVIFSPSEPLQQNLESSLSAETAETPETLKEKICASEKVLLRDLKLMRHRQVIHPVLQEGRLLLSGPPPHLLLLYTLSVSVSKWVSS